jgi:hypothetical protein
MDSLLKMYDEEFNNEIRRLRPDWFSQSADQQAIKDDPANKKRLLLALARGEIKIADIKPEDIK